MPKALMRTATYLSSWKRTPWVLVTSPSSDVTSMAKAIADEMSTNEWWKSEWMYLRQIASGCIYPEYASPKLHDSEYARPELNDFVSNKNIEALLKCQGPSKRRDLLLRRSESALIDAVHQIRELVRKALDGDHPFWNAPGTDLLENGAGISDGGMLCVYSDWLWDISGREVLLYTKKELTDILNHDIDKLRIKLEKAKRVTSSIASAGDVRRRDPIPEDVRMFVWRRDLGKCIQCDSQDKLEFDHIIPVSRGGSNTARNIQLLCEMCNRRKRDSI